MPREMSRRWSARRWLSRPLAGSSPRPFPSVTVVCKGRAQTTIACPGRRLPAVCASAQRGCALPRELRTCGRWLLDAEALQAGVELRAADAEVTGRARLVAPGALEGGDDRALFQLGEWLAGRRRGGRRGPRAGGRLGAHRDAELLARQQAAVGDDARPLDGILQLADVARPAVGQQDVARAAAQPGLAAPHLDAELAHEMAGQQQDVVAALAQRGQVDAEHGQAIEEVVTEPAVGDRALEVT